MTSISLVGRHQSLIITTSDNGLRVAIGQEKEQSIDLLYPWWNVVGARLDKDELHVDVVKARKSGSSTLVTYRGRYEGEESAARTWIEKTLATAYPNSKPSRKLQVFVNPFGGKGKALRTFTNIVKPILEAGQCSLSITYTAYRNHAYKVAQQMPLDVDCIVTVSGDGLIHECLNGLADRPDADDALKIPIAPVAAGSANALCVNVLGIEASFDVAQGCLNAMKGQPMKLDLCAIAQGGKRSFSFLAQSLGLMADLDFGTEHLRWMGETRFMYGFLKGLIANKPCPVQLEFLNPHQDKEKLLSSWQASHTGKVDLSASPTPEEAPVLEAQQASEENWIKFDKPWLYFSAGKLPYVARNLNQFPLALPTDGMIDVAIQESAPRMKIIKSIETGPSGQHLFLPETQYMKCTAYRITPLVKKGFFSVDGERFPFEPCQVRIQAGAARVLSPTGKFVNDFAGEPLK